MQYRVTEVASIHEVGEHSWNDMTLTASVYSSYPWLSYVETHPDSHTSYVVSFIDDTPAAALSVNRFKGSVPLYYDPKFLFAPSGSERSNGDLIVAGTREGYISELLFANSIPSADRPEIARPLVEKLRKIALREDARCAILYMPDESADLLSRVRRTGDSLVVIDAAAVLNVPAGGLQEYLAHLPSARRQVVRRDLRRFARSGCYYQEMPLSRCREQIAGLSVQLLSKYGHEASATEEAARFGRQAEWVDEIGMVLCAFLGERIVGFAHFMEWGGVLYARSIGFDYSVAREAGLYFNLLYYRAIEYASERGIAKIHYGCDSYDTKVSRGASLQPLWGITLDVPGSAAGGPGSSELERARISTYAGIDPGFMTGSVTRMSLADDQQVSL
jgi:uncharacterized protein